MNELPKEVWALRNKENGGLVPPMDDDGTQGGFMAWPTREEADQGLKHQQALYLDDDAHEVVRIA